MSLQCSELRPPPNALRLMDTLGASHPRPLRISVHSGRRPVSGDGMLSARDAALRPIPRCDT